jgi:hypothetical protein
MNEEEFVEMLENRAKDLSEQIYKNGLEIKRLGTAIKQEREQLSNIHSLLRPGKKTPKLRRPRQKKSDEVQQNPVQ